MGVCLGARCQVSAGRREAAGRKMMSRILESEARMDIELQAVHSGYDRKTCWVHARVGVIPGDPPVGIITTQKLRLTGSDVFYELNDLRTDDGGRTWSDFTPRGQTLGRRQFAGEDDVQENICDLTPMYHAKTQRILGIGQSVLYRDDNQVTYPRPRRTAYTVYDADARNWSKWARLEGCPDTRSFYSEGAGCTQWVELLSGELLLPTYISRLSAQEEIDGRLHAATVMRCSFDGQTLRYIEHGSEHTLPTGRGFVEPSIATVAGRYFLTLRNDDAGYVTHSDDGLNYAEATPWQFDDGSELGSYNTQQHWVTHNDDLYLVYTRKGANNDHVMRHRAPLFIAKVDVDRLCVIRETERILVPERGARLGNFGIAKVNDNETWVVVSEWMQTKLPDPYDSTICEKYGSDNTIFLAKIKFN